MRVSYLDHGRPTMMTSNRTMAQQRSTTARSILERVMMRASTPAYMRIIQQKWCLPMKLSRKVIQSFGA